MEGGSKYGGSLYCHRKFRPLSKPRLCYNTILLKGVSDGETKTKSLHPCVQSGGVLEALSSESSQKREPASVILSHRCITTNALTRR